MQEIQCGPVLPLRFSERGGKGALGRKICRAERCGIGYRLVHFYHEVNDKELYLITKRNLADIEGFVREMKTFIESYRQKKSGG
jgi:hypothetical protein